MTRDPLPHLSNRDPIAASRGSKANDGGRPLSRARGWPHPDHLQFRRPDDLPDRGGLYGATKFALEGLGEALAAEVKDLGIKVTLIEPSYFGTDFNTSSRKEGQNEIDAYAAVHRQTEDAFKEMAPGDPAHTAPVILPDRGYGRAAAAHHPRPRCVGYGQADLSKEAGRMGSLIRKRRVRAVTATERRYALTYRLSPFRLQPERSS